VASTLGVGFVEISKDTRRPLQPTESVMRSTTPPDYNQRDLVLLLTRALLRPVDRVLLVDVMATGAQATAARDLIEQAEARWVGVSLSVGDVSAEVRRRLTERERSQGARKVPSVKLDDATTKHEDNGNEDQQRPPPWKEHVGEYAMPEDQPSWPVRRVLVVTSTRSAHGGSLYKPLILGNHHHRYHLLDYLLTARRERKEVRDEK
jgi:hypothetical protein